MWSQQNVKIKSNGKREMFLKIFKVLLTDRVFNVRKFLHQPVRNLDGKDIHEFCICHVGENACKFL